MLRIDADSYQRYKSICEELPVEDDATNDYNRHPERNQGNHPSDYETLSIAQKEALDYWIKSAVVYSARGYRKTTRNSYGLKHHFEREGFYVTNGQFKGAMVVAGFIPKDIHALNWEFSIKPRWKCTSTSSNHYSGDYYARDWWYTMGHFAKEFAKLLLKAGYLG